MIIIGDVPVLPSRFGPSLYTKKGFDYYRTLTDMLHAQGCKICAQLHQSDSNLKGMIRYIPGVLTKRISMEELRPLLNQQVGPYITNCPSKRFKASPPLLVPLQNLQYRLVLIWSRFMETGCAEVLLPPVQSTHRLLWRKSRKSCAVCCGSCHFHPPRSARSAIDFKLAVRQENPHYGTPRLESELPVFVPLLEQAGVTSFHVT